MAFFPFAIKAKGKESKAVGQLENARHKQVLKAHCDVSRYGRIKGLSGNKEKPGGAARQAK